MSGYAVIDVETTGFSPRADRIVEIAVVNLTHGGEVRDSWSTLVNPQRDVGASHVHGITAREVFGAPTFDQIAPAVLDGLEGRILVAHNASFDTRFLAAELRRAGYAVGDVPAVCTMKWSSVFFSHSGRRLRDCCECAGVDLTDAHSAFGDAMATAHLFARYLERCHYAPLWGDTIAEARAFRWPTHRPASGDAPFRARHDCARARPDGWLERVVARMPRSADARVDSYLAVLEMAMLDGHLSLHEQDQLVEVARESSLSRPQLLALHAEYLCAMAEVALADGVLTDGEREDLDRAAACLGLVRTDVDDALAEVADGGALAALPVAGIALEPGDRVTFTGEMARPRPEWEATARAAGLQPGGIVKATKVLVAADPDSLSGKAAKARAYGIPIVDEAGFAKLMARLVG